MITVLTIAVTIQVLVGAVLIWKVWSLQDKLETERVENARVKEEAAEDRKLTHQLLTTVKGWALIMERLEKKKDEKLSQVAATTANNVVEVKTAIAEAVEATATKVVEKLTTAGTGDSDAKMITQPSPSPAMGVT